MQYVFWCPDMTMNISNTNTYSDSKTYPPNFYYDHKISVIHLSVLDRQIAPYALARLGNVVQADAWKWNDCVHTLATKNPTQNTQRRHLWTTSCSAQGCHRCWQRCRRPDRRDSQWWNSPRTEGNSLEKLYCMETSACNRHPFILAR